MLRTSALALLLAASLSLSACGSEDKKESSDSGFADKSAAEIEKAAKAAMKDLKTLRLSGSVVDDGEKITMDVATSTAGSCKGSLSMDGQGSLELLSVEGKTYLKPDATFWKTFAGEEAETVMGMVGDKWADFGESEDFEDFCDLDSLMEEFQEDSGEKVTKGKESTVDGTEAIQLIGTAGKEVTHAWVATSAPHYVLKMCRVEPKDEGCVSFSDFDEPVDAKAPAKDEVVDLS